MNVGGENQPLYGAVKTQVFTAGLSSLQLPQTGCGLVMLKAAAGNTGTITISSVNPAIAGTGWTLPAGESTPWLPINSLDLLFCIATAATQTLEILELK